ncbi:hypothetical protein TNCV_1910641 [Trichonephila clavipes]|nr:hypothetical protein TNCV_1910641 [Trichonephila clavipes]
MGFLGRRLAARTLPPVTIRELRLALQDEWAAMPQQIIDTLILSMGRRCETCLAVQCPCPFSRLECRPEVVKRMSCILRIPLTSSPAGPFLHSAGIWVRPILLAEMGQVQWATHSAVKRGQSHRSFSPKTTLNLEIALTWMQASSRQPIRSICTVTKVLL